MREPGYSFMALSHFMQIVCYLSRAYGISEKPDDPRAWLCVSKAIHYLEAHGDQPITVDELAASVACPNGCTFPRRSTGQATVHDERGQALWDKINRRIVWKHHLLVAVLRLAPHFTVLDIWRGFGTKFPPSAIPMQPANLENLVVDVGQIRDYLWRSLTLSQ